MAAVSSWLLPIWINDFRKIYECYLLSVSGAMMKSINIITVKILVLMY